MAKTNKKPINLKPFTGKRPFRPELSIPFNYGGFTYATDGRILVRVKRGNVPGGTWNGYGPKLRKTARATADYFKGFPSAGFKEIEIPNKAAVPVNNRRKRVVQIGSRNFDMAFLTPMRRLPGLRVHLADRAKPTDARLGYWFDGGGPMEFVFHGGEGMVMPTLGQSTCRIA